MKIKVSGHWGNVGDGDIVDAAVSPSKNQVTFYNSASNCLYTLYSGQFEIIEDEEPKASKHTINSIREAIGQDIKMIEFK